jgi:hypothetical protein
LKNCCEHSSVILEIDPPVDELAVRRKRFYQRLGFKTNSYAHLLHLPYREQFPPHELAVMSYPKYLTEMEYQTFQCELGKIVMEDAALPGAAGELSSK